MIRILAVDAALRRSGWALVEEQANGLGVVQSGSISTKGQIRSVVLAGIGSMFISVVEATGPTVVYFEESGLWRRKGGSSTASLLGVAMARAVMLAACGARGLRAEEVNVREVRMTLLMSPNAGKEDVFRWLQRRGFPIPTLAKGRPDLDVVDAIALGVYGALQEGANLTNLIASDVSKDEFPTSFSQSKSPNLEVGQN